MEEPVLICVRTCQGLDLAQIYRSKLEALGIPVLLKYESAGLVYGITVDGLGAVHIMVPEPYAAEAEAALTDLPADELIEESMDKEPVSGVITEEVEGDRPGDELPANDSADL
jgi:hypothetical protein